MEERDLGVNAGNTKSTQCRVSRVQSEESGEHSHGVSRKGVASNSILCVKCHERSSGIKGKLKCNVM